MLAELGFFNKPACDDNSPGSPYPLVETVEMLMLKFDLPRVPISGEGTGFLFFTFFSSKKIIFILHAKIFFRVRNRRVKEEGGGG